MVQISDVYAVKYPSSGKDALETTKIPDYIIRFVSWLSQERRYLSDTSI